MADQLNVKASQLWLELEPISLTAPPRLIFFLHGGNSSPEEFVPVAISWQLKFPGARSFLMQAPRERSKGRFYWFDPYANASERNSQSARQAHMLKEQIFNVQKSSAIPPAQTLLVAFDQGASLALDLLRLSGPTLIVGVTALFSARLLRPFAPTDHVAGIVHLIHGQLDSITPLVYARQAFDGLKAIGTQASLDIIDDAAHGIQQDAIILGTTRALQSVFKGRRVVRRGLLH